MWKLKLFWDLVSGGSVISIVIITCWLLLDFALSNETGKEIIMYSFGGICIDVLDLQQ